MATWKVARPTRTCALTGAPLGPGVAVVTALFGAEEEVSEDRVRGAGFVRKDFLADASPPEAIESALAGAFCVWRSRTPPAEARAPVLDVEMARDLLERLCREDDPARAAVRMTLALLLVRKRRLALVRQSDDALVLRWPREDATFAVPIVVVTEAEEAQLEQELTRLFDA